MRKLYFTALALVVIFCCQSFYQPTLAIAQGNENYGNGLRLYLNKDSTSFIRMLMWTQVWLRYIEQNPGTSVNNNPDSRETFDIGLRRSRMLFHGQVSPKLLVFWILGINNQTFNSGGLGIQSGNDPTTDGKRQQVFVHDAWTEFKFARELHIGAGLLTWSGLSRQTNAATLNFLAIDSPVFGWATLDATDQFARMFGIFAKGEIDKFNYRAVLSKPFAIPNPGTISGAANTPAWAQTFSNLPNAYNIAQWAGNNNSMLYQAYASYDFFDQESSVLPFMVGSYAGSKKVFNIGAGFLYHPRAFWNRSPRANAALPASIPMGADRDALLGGLNAGAFPAASTIQNNPSITAFNGAWNRLPAAQQTAVRDAYTDTSYTDMRCFAVDFFLDLPFRYKADGSPDPAGDALTAHGTWWNYNMGPNYVRNIATMNIGNANPAGREQPEFNGAGNGYPIHGTGNIFYLQAGYLCPKEWTNGFGRLQPYGALSYVDFDRLNQPYFMPEVGLNWLLAGQNAKISVHYRPRPVYGRAFSTTPGRELLDGMQVIGSRNEIITQFFIYL
jgi:hypothetical protein